MIVMEGLLLVPPERGTIIGRALWKVCLQSWDVLFGNTRLTFFADSICRPWYRVHVEDAERSLTAD